MPTYYFDTNDGKRLYRDEHGLELQDDEAARDEARKAIGELTAEFIPEEGPTHAITMSVRNAEGGGLLELSVVFTLKLPGVEGSSIHDLPGAQLGG
jgi:hypothetical protein